MFTLGETKGQHGHYFADDYLVLENGLWYRHMVNCNSSLELDLGTCRCVSHDQWTVTQISRDEASKIIGADRSELTPEEIQALNKLTPQESLAEKLSLAKITLDQLETFCGIAYRIDHNPLPATRKLLEGSGIDVVYAIDSGNTHFNALRPTLVCWHDMECNSVRLELEMPF